MALVEEDKSGMTDSYIIYRNQSQRTESWDWKFEIDGKIDVNLISSTNVETLVPLLFTKAGIISAEHEVRHNISPWDESINMVKVVDSGNKIYEGRLLDRGENWVEMASKDRFRRIRDYSLLSLDKAKEQSHVKINLKGWNDGVLQLSYLFDKCYWEPRYWALISPNSDDKIAYLRMSAKIFNNTGEILKPTCLSLISGDINRPIPEERVQMRSMSAVSYSSPQSQGVVQSDNIIQEYVRFDVEPTDLKSTTLITLKTATNLPADKFYRGNITYISSSEEEYTPVEFGYRFTPDFYMPPGSLEWYQLKQADEDICHAGIGAYLGSSFVHETSPNEESELIVGKTHLVTVKAIQEVSFPINSDSAEGVFADIQVSENINKIKKVHFKINIRNRDQKSIKLELQYDIGNQKLISSEPAPDFRTPIGIKWLIEVNPAEETVIELSFNLSAR